MYAFPDGYSFFELAETTSTNLYAMQQIHAGLAAHGHAYFAHQQSGGKGQRGKSWHALPGESILISMILDTSKLATSQSFRLSAAVALAASCFLQQLTHCKIGIKWPNDIYLTDKKAGGILIENVVQGNTWRWAVVGIGININQTIFPAELPNAISVKMATGQPYDCARLAKQLCGSVHHFYSSLLQGNWAAILEQYNAMLFGRCELKRLKYGNSTAAYLINRVNEQGMLVAGEKEEWAFDHGTVEWVGLSSSFA